LKGARLWEDTAFGQDSASAAWNRHGF
jgi:hypothetical protein